MTESFDLEKIASLPNIYLPKLSNDQTRLGFFWDKTGSLEFYIYDLVTKSVEQISNGEFPKDLKSEYIWNWNDTEILFTKDKDGDEQQNIFSFHLESKELVQLTETPTAQDYIVDSFPDNKGLLFISNRIGQMNIFRMDNDGKNVIPLTAHENPVGFLGGEIKLSPDGKFIAYCVNESNDLKNLDIYLFDIDNDDTNRIISASSNSQDKVHDWSKDGKYIIFSTDKDGVDQPGLYNVGTKEIKIFGDKKHEEMAIGITNDNKRLICLSNTDSSLFPFIYEVESGKKITFDFPEGIAYGFAIRDGRYLYLQFNQTSNPSSLIEFDIETSTIKTLVESETKGIDKSLFVQGEHIWYPSKDGTKIPAILYKPRNFDKNNRYPGIIVPHGGPTGQYFMNFNFSAQYLASKGYVVMFPNVRGSTGYGVEFRDACIQDWGGKDHEDWVAGRQYLIDHCSVDENNIGVYGGSYGGYATLVCMTKSPDLWKVGVSIVPVSHMMNLYEKSMEHFKYYFRQQMGDPAKNKDLWEERSPLNYANQVTNHLLLIHGKNDPRCPVTESRNFADALIKSGKKKGRKADFDYIEYEDEGHGMVSDITHRIRTFKDTFDYIDQILVKS